MKATRLVTIGGALATLSFNRLCQLVVFQHVLHSVNGLKDGLPKLGVSNVGSIVSRSMLFLFVVCC